MTVVIRYFGKARICAGYAPLIAAALVSTGAMAQAGAELAAQKNCTACHALDSKRVGPPFQAVAARYAGQKDATALLTLKVQQGGVGAWGQVPMPANPKVNSDEARRLVAWILSLKK